MTTPKTTPITSIQYGVTCSTILVKTCSADTMTRCRIPSRPGYGRSAELQPCAAQFLIFFLSVAADLPASQPSTQVPGAVIDHRPATSGLYIGSPSIAILTNGEYVASHDFFGPKSKEFESATTVVFRSADRGHTWKKVSEIHGAFWSSLYVHHGAIYLLGPNRHHGDIYIRRSTDRGETWTEPANSHTGVLRENGQYHCAPMPVVEHNGRLWRAFERRNPPEGWGTSYCAGMLSMPVDADLLDAANW